MGIDRENTYLLLRNQMESVGFIFEKEQQPHFQNQRDKELKFVHPQLEEKFAKLKINNRAKKFYLKPLTDVENSEIGLTTGKTSPLIHLSDFPVPNALDTYKNNVLNAWVNRENDNALDSLFQSITDYLFLTIEELEESFLNEVKKSMSESASEREIRLKSATKKPEKIIVSTVAYRRNPDVVVEALIRANGRCEGCFRNAPFIRKKDGSPYLEVHHIVPLSVGGEDTVENVIALCPNCHRERHFG